jgi:D-alanyl-D-alanine carboxypeptidase
VAFWPAMTEGQLDPAARVRHTLATRAGTSNTPAVQYVVVNASGAVFEHAGGWADVRRQVPMDVGTTMMAYSMSKTITAVAVLQLVEARRLGLDDPVEQYVDAFPYGAKVTVRQLIAHLSGIPNPIPLRWVHPADRHASFDEAAALAAVLRTHPRLSFEPGTQYAYSNIGYWLLGKVVERTSGQTFTSYVTEHVLRPLEITPRELGYLVQDPARHAMGYLEKYSIMNLVKGFLIDRELVGDYAGRWLEIRSHYLNGPAFGGLVGTVRAFGKFLQDQLRQQSVLFTDATRQLLHAPQQTLRGVPVAMTLGWHIGQLGGTRYFYKEGGGGGFHCMMRLYPDSEIGTIVMSNATGFDVRGLLDATDAVFLQTQDSKLRTPNSKPKTE